MISVRHAIDRGRCWHGVIVGVVATVGGGCTTSTPALDPQPGYPACRTDEGCPLGEICSLGECVDGCRPGAGRCPPGTGCLGGQCVPLPDSGVGGGTGGGVSCPDDMVRIANTICMDRWEASRPDATDVLFGDDESAATSRPNVLPWYPVDKETAQLACAMVGKRLCTVDEFSVACRGPAGTVYGYGDTYDPVICNGIDTYCRCGSDTLCEGIAPCPYPHCYDQPPSGQSEPAIGCGAVPRAKPTGAFADCKSGYGVYDLNGNVWELVDDGSANGQFRGGAFNCKNSETLHRCDYVAGPITAKGFRCCR